MGGGWPDTKRVNGLARVVVRVLVEHLAHVLVLMGAARGGGNMRGTALPKHTHTFNTHTKIYERGGNIWVSRDAAPQIRDRLRSRSAPEFSYYAPFWGQRPISARAAKRNTDLPPNVGLPRYHLSAPKVITVEVRQLCLRRCQLGAEPLDSIGCALSPRRLSCPRRPHRRCFHFLDVLLPACRCNPWLDQLSALAGWHAHIAARQLARNKELFLQPAAASVW